MTGYWDRSTWPLQSLYFLLPVLVLYEVGAIFYQPDGGALPRILAERLMQDFLDQFGAAALFLPGFLVAALLMFQHLARRDSWGFEWKLHLMMWAESICLALPLFVFAMVLLRQPGMALATGGAEASAGGHGIPDWFSGVLLSVGAGIYEELLFRLIAITLLHLLLADVLKLEDSLSMAVAVGLSAVTFALYHFTGSELRAIADFSPAQWARLAFFCLAGAYFGLIFVLRGFGITAATHALYDVLIVTVLFSADA